MTTLYPMSRLRQPISGEGARFADGRFNRKGGYPLTYLADHPHTALLEYRYTTATDDGVTHAHAVPPVALYSVTYRVARALDLTETSVQEALEAKPASLAAPWWLDNEAGVDSDTQVLARLVHECGRFDSIRYRSARTSRAAAELCLAVFPDRLTAPSYLRIEPPAHRSFPKNVVQQLP